ncbi:unnamed protein product, partial [marine sediment metagenome]
GPLAAMALRRNIHTFSEIPLVCSVEQAEELWQADEQSEALFMTGANANFWGFVEAAVDLKNKGLLGEPYYAEAEYVHDIRFMFEQSPWRRTLEPIRYCTHSLGPVLRWIDEDLASVSCFDTGGHVRGAADEHDAMVAHFRTPSNVVVRLLTSFINNAPAEHQYRLFGTKGYFA